MAFRKAAIAPQFSEHEQNRQRFTAEELIPYKDQWVAFSLDGKRIVASADDLIELDRRVRAQGDPISDVGLEYIAMDDCQGFEAELA